MDKKNDLLSSDECALRKRGGWWYNACADSNPNGFYWNGTYSTYHNEGIHWNQWLGNKYSLPFVEMKMRPL
jgi:ficolin